MGNSKEISITANKGILNLQFADIWAYRDLILLLVRRDFVANYKQTVLGPLWLFIQPLFTTFMFTFLFAKIGGITTDKVPSDLFYLSGIVFWNYFASCLKTNSTTFISNQNVFGKVYFPRIVIPLSVTLSNLIKFGIQFLLFAVYYIYFLYQGADIHVTKYILLLPANILLLGLLSLGVGILISSLTTKYRDLSYLVDFGLQLLMYATIIFPVSYFPDNLKWFASVNPLIPIIETTKLGLLGAGTFSLSSYLFCIAITAVILVIGSITFNWTEQNFMDVV